VGIFLGIDGGGSRTSCVIGDETSLLGSGTAGPSNVVRVGEKQARESISSAVRQACTTANVSPAQIQRTCAGVAGGARPETAAMVRRLVSELVPSEIEVVGDMVIALQAAWGGDPGVVVIAGTGSIAYGRNFSGLTARAGGWGFAISDEGSGHWIGRAAVAAAMRAYDEGHSTRLLDGIMSAWVVGTPEQMILAANSVPPPDFAALMGVVLSAADAEDPTALAILSKAGAELAALAKIVITRFFAKDLAPVAMCGGVFRNSALIRQVFYNTLRSEFPDAFIKQEIVDPVNGALELARRGRPAAGS